MYAHVQAVLALGNKLSFSTLCNPSDCLASPRWLDNRAGLLRALLWYVAGAAYVCCVLSLRRYERLTEPIQTAEGGAGIRVVYQIRVGCMTFIVGVGKGTISH